MCDFVLYTVPCPVSFLGLLIKSRWLKRDERRNYFDKLKCVTGLKRMSMTTKVFTNFRQLDHSSGTSNTKTIYKNKFLAY